MKKKSFLLVLIVLLISSAYSQEIKKQTLKTTIHASKIYLTGAEISRRTKINLKAGRTELTFTNISPKLNSKSIRITTADEVDLLSISTKINYLTKVEELPRIKQLKDSLLLISMQIQNNKDETDAYNIEKKMLLANLSIGGEDNGVAITELQQASDFYRTRIMEINKKLSEILFQTTEHNKTTYRLQSELNELNAQSSYSRSEIIILVYSEKALTTDFELQYLVNDAGWSPSYDIKAEDTDKPINFVYRANVFNNTGIEWKDIDITLSTADWSLNISKPTLNPWYLSYASYDFYSNISTGEGYTQNKYAEQTDFSNAYQEVDNNYYQDVNWENTDNDMNLVEATIPELSAEFEIDKKYTIPSDDKPYLVDVSEHELPATYKHYAVTKLDKFVFLLARVTGWEDLNLVDGPANIYYAGTYLGQSFIQTRNVKDTLDLSLGRDSKVLVTRTKLKDFSSTQFIGTKRKETLTYELVAKNNRKTEVDIEIIDQLPISQSDEIEVKILEISDAEYTEETGKLTWHFKLKPGEIKKIRLSFSIKYPKNKKVQLKQQRKSKVRYF